MNLTLLDYNNTPVEVTIASDIDEIRHISIQVYSGDEVAEVCYKNGSIKTFDSSSSRLMNFFDGSYPLYCSGDTDNLLNDPEWLARKDSYEFVGRI